MATTPDPPTIVDLGPAHVRGIAALVAARVRGLRERVPVVPEAWTGEAHVAPYIERLVTRGSGAVALADEQPVAFHLALLLDGHGGRWAWSPDIGHARADDVDDRVVERLYARLADAWVRAGCTEHVVTVMADDRDTLDCLWRLGFGQYVIDLVRGLDPVPGGHPAGVAVRRAGPADVRAVVALDAGLRRHLAASPVFLRMGPARSPDVQRRILGDPSTATFLAEEDDRAIAFLRIGPAADDVAMIVRDPGTASITGAFTVPDRRGDDVATALLAAAVDWARDAGYARCGVDHESANREGGRFWARHFTPVAISVARRLPPHAAT